MIHECHLAYGAASVAPYTAVSFWPPAVPLRFLESSVNRLTEAWISSWLHWGWDKVSFKWYYASKKAMCWPLRWSLLLLSLYTCSGPSWSLKPMELMERLVFSELLCYYLVLAIFFLSDISLPRPGGWAVLALAYWDLLVPCWSSSVCAWWTKQTQSLWCAQSSYALGSGVPSLFSCYSHDVVSRLEYIFGSALTCFLNIFLEKEVAWF